MGLTSVTSTGCSSHPHFCPAQLQSGGREVSRPRFPKSNSLLERLRGLRKTVRSCLLAYYKGHNSRANKRKRSTGRGLGWGWRRMELPRLLLRGHHPPSTSMRSPTQMLSKPCCSGVFVQVPYEDSFDEITGHW